MKALVSSADFLASVNSVMHAVVKNQELGTTTDAMLEFDQDGIRLTGACRWVMIERKMQGQVLEYGKVLIPTAKLKTLLSSMPDQQIEVTNVGVKFEIVVKRKKKDERYTFITQSADAFPTDRNTFNAGFFISGTDLKKTIQRATLACDVNSTRYALGGCQFARSGDRLRVASYDGSQLAVQYVTIQDDLHFLDAKPVVPLALLNVVKSLVSDDVVHVQINPGSAVSFTWDDVRVVGHLCEGRFPAIEKVLELTRDDALAKVDCTEMSEALSRLSATASPESNAIKLMFETDELSMKNPKGSVAVGQASVDCTYAGPEQSIWIAGPFLADAISIVGATSPKDAKHASLGIMKDGCGLAVFAGGYTVTIAQITQRD